MKSPLGARLTDDGASFGVYAPDATALWLCLFDAKGAETRVPMHGGRHGIWSANVKGVVDGQRYGLRADGPYAPALGHFFDPDKLLVDPFATRIDRQFEYHEALGAHRGAGPDTAPIMPRAVLEKPAGNTAAPTRRFKPGGLVYELNARAFTIRHVDVPPAERGTLRALAHPAIIEHFGKLGVDAVELMPIAAWIDERHLPPLGLSNAWGYNPVTLMAPDPRLAPGGIGDLAFVTRRLRSQGIAVILDLVFNHTGESDLHGPVLSLRGLANNASYRHDEHHRLVNDTGTGNTLDCQHPFVIRLVIDALRHFVLAGGVEGFRFDLATVLGRSRIGFHRNAALLHAILADPVLAGRVLVAEPWDIGPGGYQLGHFPDAFIEWNDRYRDTVRKFWRGDAHMLGALATALAGSSDVFSGTCTRSVNFIAAHDGFTLADLVSHKRKHNATNGEDNRDGHDDNHSWNNGVEGATHDPAIIAARKRDIASLLSLLFVSRGTIMLTAGDEFGRTQQGNNNAYCQDNELTWVDWTARDAELEEHAATLARIRRQWPHLGHIEFLTGDCRPGHSHRDVSWLAPDASAMTPSGWEDADAGALAMVLAHPDAPDGPRLAVLVNRHDREIAFTLPGRAGYFWRDLIGGTKHASGFDCPARTVMLIGEEG
ncbi:MAG: glycogen debranching protein GlgX [Nitratireductor sp.]|nr:glycogen debranching protein GlgX [Nitratireductor sp.]